MIDDDWEKANPALGKYVTNDSGKQAEYEDGMRRDTHEGKPKFGLMFPEGVSYEEQLLTRVAALYTRGGEKYGDRNWENSRTQESLDHHREAFWRHAVKFFLGVDDGEDHAAAVVWNVNAIELTRRNMKTAYMERLEAQESEAEEPLKTYVFPVPDSENPGVYKERRIQAPDYKTARAEFDEYVASEQNRPVLALKDRAGDYWRPGAGDLFSCWYENSPPGDSSLRNWSESEIRHSWGPVKTIYERPEGGFPWD